jgi:hypothetical protein
MDLSISNAIEKQEGWIVKKTIPEVATYVAGIFCAGVFTGIMIAYFMMRSVCN